MGRTIFASQDKWRKHPMISGGAKGMLMFPGLLTATAIFSVYLVVETIYKQVTAKPHSGTIYKYKKNELGEMPELAKEKKKKNKDHH
mmetsp:Transcript_3662/g.9409  ORF Transcript_3662/g.9409 Transcript_3662/m.9409 type:complete len:87 (-) Transcript_3662:306-566(-)|eukprot:CAMPEP_0197417052 /NCGR_PEP_ID=MMETSP1170-20131217/3214_1 /TAXON_ID=54406 /ORGANISM="Sarcinochrysis sp, Strain CCMP770" /LENGTH=86 /DNA_ID=CAMNT_0042943991 /DNA_START=44 /DNA_END=304 /DNA_ORIENTATION=+